MRRKRVAYAVLGSAITARLAWCAHISFDRSLGFGLRTTEGFQRT